MTAAPAAPSGLGPMPLKPQRASLNLWRWRDSRELEAEVAPAEMIQEEVTAHAALENGCALETTASPCQRGRRPRQPPEEVVTLVVSERG